jgi:hypothetical protein
LKCCGGKLLVVNFTYKSSLVPDMKVRGQPACLEAKKKYCVVYICSLYMRYHAPLMLTFIIVLSRLVVKGGCTSEIGIVETNNKLLGGPRKTNKVDTR